MSTVKAAAIGGIAGIMLVMTTGWLITGHLGHRFQRFTPSTWRPESWRQHALAVLWSAIGGCALGALGAQIVWSHSSVSGALIFAGLLWAAIGAPVIATMATYINLHRAVVTGLLLEWLAFAVGVSLACFRWAT